MHQLCLTTHNTEDVCNLKARQNGGSRVSGSAVISTQINSGDAIFTLTLKLLFSSFYYSVLTHNHHSCGTDFDYTAVT